MDQWFWCLPCEESPLKRQAYPWREASHPLLRRRTLRADGATVFGVHFGGHVLQLLSHHIVHGEVPVWRKWYEVHPELRTPQLMNRKIPILI